MTTTTNRRTTAQPRAAWSDAPPAHPRSDRVFRSRQRRRRGAADLLAILAWASAAMAVTLWLVSGTVDLSGVGQVVTAAGIVAGLIGTDLILVMLVLAARIPVIDRLVGHDAAMVQHGKLGKPSLYLLLAHGALLIVGYALESHENVLAESVALWRTPDVLLSFLALAGFIAVVWTSIVAVRRVLPYEAWHGIHLLSYVAGGLAIPHQLSEGQMLAHGTWERVYWIVLYVVALGSIAVFRFGLPAVRSLRHRVVVDRVEGLADGVVSLHLRGRDLSRLRATGGQFFMWRFWAAGSWWHAHPISLSAAPTDTGMRITVRALGRGSAQLAHLRPGTPVSFAGPYGVFTEATRTSTRIAVAASGIGVTPVRAFLERLDAPPGAVTILLRGRNERETYLWDEVIAWARSRGHRVFTSIGPRGRGTGGWLAAGDTARGASAASVFPDLAHSDLYICGPGNWSDLVEQDALRAGLPVAHLHRERFDW
ncbi:ferric reductase-like transmembrane domain-containing protein [Curtobacterium sp. ISL-83]|uniref:ferredoxin reductase family protein n=1 Tax=Curtobacterium sp. ISL-83 TaxID=2819145 RepID=UPI001BE8C373|nr:ferric reductase-like transmembrane domain-containing protein [Curtobacterium sp. ISL-83]MBT2503176.1 ferric reductase-like transmembrane domain-containing protein [Curtobacterium sp. ISL-83]